MTKIKKVFWGDRSLLFVSDSSQISSEYEPVEIITKKDFIEFIHLFECSPTWQHVAIRCTKDVNHWKTLKKHLKKIPAAGGVVFNSQGKILVIKRLGFWDLPKGKIEARESKKQAALREVCEECGLKPQHLKVGEKIMTTWHTYRTKNDHCLKKNNWYTMYYAADHPTIPCSEEHIEEARWADIEEIEQLCANSYASLQDLWEVIRSRLKNKE